MEPARRRRWRDYRTASGNRPIRDYLFSLPLVDRAEIVAAMREVRERGTAAARHLRGAIYEVRADAGDVIYRVLFAEEGRYSQVLLSLEVFAKKTQKTPPAKIQLAERRLADWRSRRRIRQR